MVKEKIKRLTDEINRHNDLYYNKDSPIISDFDYDVLLKQLIKLEEKYPELRLENSPTKLIGGVPSSSFEKINHKVFMGSLQNAYSYAELLKFEEKIKEKNLETSYIVEPKVDGLSVSLEYEDGKFVRGSTRGDGFVGEDVTENLKTINNIPKNLTKNVEYLEVRAEIYMPQKEFNKLVLNQKNSGEVPFKNPRNAAAGSLRQKNAFITSTRGLKAVCFNIQQIRGHSLKTHKDSIDFLTDLGFYTILQSTIYEKIKDCFEKIEEIKDEKKYYDFEIDGAVIKLNSLKSREILGSTAKNPRWAIAFKYPPEQQTTIIKDIEIKIGRTGVLTPIAILNPVNISGTTVKKATLHNQEFIDKNDIRIKDLISIKKAGEIIPEVVKSLKHEENSVTYKIPNICPACGNNVVRVKSFIRCVNPSCPATILQNIVHFVSKNAMNITGLGEQTIKTLIEKNLIKDISDLYFLKREDVLNLEKFQEKSTNNLLNSIENSKKNPPWRLLFGLGINEVGQKTAKLICEEYGSILNIMDAKTEDLLKIKDVGEVTALNITRYFSSHKTKSLIIKLKELNLNLTNSHEKTAKSRILEGKYFVITGKFEDMPREKIKSLIEENSGEVLNSVSKKTTYLIAGEKAGSKLEKAKKLNIKILNKEKFLKLLS